MSIWFTTYTATVSYQNMSDLRYREIHLLRFISFYCTLIYNNYVNLLGFISSSSQNSAYLTNNHHKTFPITQISNQYLLCYLKRSFLAADTESFTVLKYSTVQTKQTKKESHGEKILKDGYVSGVVQSCELLIQQKYASV